MDSVWELNSQISNYRMRIEECRYKIEEDNEKVAELMALQGRISAMTMHLGDAQSVRKNKLYQAMSALDGANRYSKKIIASYDTRMNDLFVGTEYVQTMSGLENAEETVACEIRHVQDEIEMLWSEISSLEQAISRCEAEIAEIERQERERRAREEWEARMAYEARMREENAQWRT